MAQHVFRLRFGIGVFNRQQVHHFLFERPDVVPVLGGKGQHGEAKGVEFGQHGVFVLHAVHLVDHQQGRLPGPAHERGKVLLERHQAVAPVHHEAKHRSLIHGGLRLLEDFRLEPAQPFGAVGYGMVAVERHAPGVDQGEGTPAPRTHHAFHTVAGDARTVMGDGPVTANKPIEQRGLAHVGTAKQSDFGEHATSSSKDIG